jgi:hypothetical protein
MISDTDYDLLDKRLKAIEDSLEMLKALFPVKEGQSTAHSDYVLIRRQSYRCWNCPDME